MNEKTQEVKKYYLCLKKITLEDITAIEFNLQIDVFLNIYFMFQLWTSYFLFSLFQPLHLCVIVSAAYIHLHLKRLKKSTILNYGMTRSLVYLVTVFRLIRQICHGSDASYVIIRILFVLVFGYLTSLGTIVNHFVL